MEKEVVLEGREISYTYETGIRALENSSFSIRKGDKIALLGNNGAGKSTLFLCCNGVRKPQKGKLLLDGKEVKWNQKGLEQLRKTIGLVFQNPDHQMIASTVEQEVSFGPMNLSLSKEVVAERTKKALAQMGLSDYEKRPTYFLSGGEKKRVTLADVLAMEPKVMLLDEPTASLDSIHCRILEKTLERLHGKGMALVVSTHDVDFAWRFAERGMILVDGEILKDASIAEIFDDEALLKKAGLEKPMVFQMAQWLHPEMKLEDMPRTIEELIKIGKGKADEKRDIDC